LAKSLRSIIVQKGEVDCISDGELGIYEFILEYECKEEGTPKRCGGQGDVLAGVIASKIANMFSESTEFVKKTALERCYESCVFNRKLMRETFGKYKMSMITNDALKVFKYLNSS
jgi:ATP-dependent NAD(P)H-hydrate dehydratase